MLNLPAERQLAPQKEALHILLDEISSSCTDCGRCVTPCEFLKRFGSPKRIADRFDPENPAAGVLSFSCNLCGLCTAVCPEGVDPVPLFHKMRSTAFEEGHGDFSKHRRLLRYEARGRSPRYSWYGLPEGCDTVFFPGCALPGTRPSQTLSTFEKLYARIPALGIVLDCCTKPSHDLGRMAAFHAAFGALKTFLLSSDIRTVITACPNCYRVFKDYGAPLRVMSVYEALEASDFQSPSPCEQAVSVHDSCAVRFDTVFQTSVRRLLGERGVFFAEMRNSGARTLCCGEGAGVSQLQPELGKRWTKKRGSQAGGRHLLTYCAGCADMLSKKMSVSHVLDRVITPDTPRPFKRKRYAAIMIYINRLRLKRFFRRTLKARHSGTRPYSGS